MYSKEYTFAPAKQKDKYMVGMQKGNKWKLLIITLFCISTLLMSCIKFNSDSEIYSPSLLNALDYSTEESKISQSLETSKSIMDTTTNKNTFKRVKLEFDQALSNYEFIYSHLSEEGAHNQYSANDQIAMISLRETMDNSMRKFGESAYKYEQVEKEGLDVLINFNLLKKELNISEEKKFDIYDSFEIVDKNIAKYNRIKDAYDSLMDITNKDNIAYYNQHPNRYQVVFICANLKELITIRSFIEKTSDLYTNRKDKQYVKANKLDINNLTKELKSIGNRRELCNLYLPNETKKLRTLERFVLTIR